MFTAGFLGVLIGLVLGLTGAGGGILAVPALVIGLGFDITTAAPIALIAVGLAALLGAADGLRKHQVRYKAAIFMAASGAVCSTVGIRLAHALPEVALITVFSGVMLLIAMRTARQALIGAHAHVPRTNKPCQLNPATGRLRWTRRCTATLAAIGAVTGIFAGMLGVGGGFIIVPALRRYTDINMHGIISTSLMLIALVSLSAATGAFLHGITVPKIGWVFIMATITGMVAGRSISTRVPAQTLHIVFAALTVSVACILLWRAWMPA